MPYIYSTLSNSQNYTKWASLPDGGHYPAHSVLIQGGHGVADKHFMTPQGVVTSVTDDELAMLMTIDAFKMHMDAGHIKVEDRKYDTEKIAADMARNDGSAPVTEEEILERANIQNAPKVGTEI